MSAQLSLYDRPSRLELDFAEFHRANPDVWALFQRFAFEVLRSGHRRYSADAILHRVRWHTSVETRSRDGLKLNNNHAAYYARLFEREHPEHGGFFRKRAVRK